MKRFAIICLILSLLCAAQAEEQPTAKGEVFTMDTYIYIVCTGERAGEAVEACKAEFLRLNDLLSIGVEDSEISIINKNGSGTVSDDTAEIIGTALDVYKSTGGAFDITVYPLMELWGFVSGDYRVPGEQEIASTLSKVDAGRVSYDADTRCVTLGDGQGIDLGGIAKGFASDRAMEIFDEYGITSGYVSLGGNVEIKGVKPDGSQWKIGVQDPHDTSGLVGTVSASDCALITSGAYQRCFTSGEDGKTYHHIIDPATGYPSDSDLISVTVVSRKGILADALSTSCYIMGKEAAIEYWKEYGNDFELVLMTDDDNVYITEGLKDTFSCNYPLTVISR